MQDFDIAQILSNLPKFAQILLKYCPNLINFASKNLLGDAAAYVA